MTTIAQLEVMVNMDTRKVEEGIKKIDSDMTTMAKKQTSLLGDLNTAWRAAMVGIGMATGALYGAISAAGMMDVFKDSLEKVTSQIGRELQPTIATLVNWLNALADSDIPARIGDGLVLVFQAFRAALNAAATNLDAIMYAISWISNDKAGMAKWSEQMKTDLGDIDDALGRVRQSGTKMWEGYGGQAPWTPLSNENPLPGGTAPKSVKSPSMMEMFEATTYETTERTRLRRTPEQMQTYLESKGTDPALIAAIKEKAVNITVKVDSIQSWEKPEQVMRKVGEGIAHGFTIDKVRPLTG